MREQLVFVELVETNLKSIICAKKIADPFLPIRLIDVIVATQSVL